jgi:RecG-like helicase
MALTLDTPILELHRDSIAHVSSYMSKKLAAAVASFAEKSDPGDATVEDLLNYFPMRYEDRSSFLQIDQLYDGIEATVELYTGVSGG